MDGNELKYRFGGSIRIESNMSCEFTYLDIDGNKELVVKSPFSQIIPILKVSGLVNKNFISIVDEILDFVKNENYLDELANKTKVKELKSQIDQMVYKFYMVTEKKIAIIK